MKNAKTGSLIRLVAFLLITVVLIGAVGLVSEGMSQAPEDKIPGGESADNIPNDEGATAPPSNEEPVVTPEVPPKHLNYLSGLECTQEAADKIPTAFLLDSAMPLYGMSDSVLSIEFPIEDGTSRILMFTDSTRSIGKIGSITKTRKFINAICSSFGGILVHNGEDDSVNYSTNKQLASAIDLSKSSSYAYSEGSSYLYTNSDLMTKALDNSRVPTRFSAPPSLPFLFQGFFDDALFFENEAKTIQLPFSESNRVTLSYDEASRSYYYQRNGINGAFARLVGEDQECELELAFHPEDLGSPYSQDVVAFAENVCMEHCHVRLCWMQDKEGNNFPHWQFVQE